MNASSAYALGYHGQGVALGVMDSGALLQKHPELAGDRFHASHASGVYGSTGNRYQESVSGVGDVFGNGDFTEGEAFDIDGNWISHVNDTHGTHVTGTVGANRDGSEFHGVSWGSDIWVGNTGGTDNTNYGLPQDYNFFYAGWSALAQNLISVNGAERGGVINNSFGTNLRINEGGSSLNTNTTGETEYEYFLFKQNYGDAPSFVDAAYDAVKGTNVVQVMTTGNRDMAMPYYRSLYPYFNPDAEKHWIAWPACKRKELALMATTPTSGLTASMKQVMRSGGPSSHLVMAFIRASFTTITTNQLRKNIRSARPAMPLTAAPQWRRLTSRARWAS